MSPNDLPNNWIGPTKNFEYWKYLYFETSKNKKSFSGQLKDEPESLGANSGQVSQKSKTY